jgi:hypothetical protein
MSRPTICWVALACSLGALGFAIAAFSMALIIFTGVTVNG